MKIHHNRRSNKMFLLVISFFRFDRTTKMEMHAVDRHQMTNRKMDDYRNDQVIHSVFFP